MFKLLTEDSKAELEREYASRRAMLAVVSLSIILGIALISLFPSYLLSTLRLGEATARVNSLTHSPMREDSDALERWFSSFKQKLTVLAPKSNIGKPYELFLLVLSAQPETVKLTGFSWKTDTKGNVLNVEGFAQDRKALLDFEGRLNALGSFSKVSLPVSNFAKDKDIEFELTISPKT